MGARLGDLREAVIIVMHNFEGHAYNFIFLTVNFEDISHYGLSIGF